MLHIANGRQPNQSLHTTHIQFKSRLEAYVYAIVVLQKISEMLSSKLNESDFDRISSVLKMMRQCITRFELAFENHEQDVQQVCDETIEKLIHSHKLDDYSNDCLGQLKCDILNGHYEKASLYEKFENPIGRYFLSALYSNLLLNPTANMMMGVEKLSDEIIKVLRDLNSNFPMHIESFLKHLLNGEDVLCIDAFDHIPTLEEVINLLKKNQSNDLAKILFVHFLYARELCRFFPIKAASTREPIGKLAKIIEDLGSDTTTFFGNAGIGSPDKRGDRYRSHIIDTLFSKSNLFTADDGKRGRKGDPDICSTNELGLMLFHQKHYGMFLPTLSTSWYSDSKVQEANFTSPYVLNLILNDAVYVAGPSSMTGLFLNAMELLGNFETIELKQHYLLAIASYIVGGGFHSLAEVIEPAEYVLGLVPGYPVCIPEVGKLPSPPPYSIFYELQKKIDDEFADNYKFAWDLLLQVFSLDHTRYPSLFNRLPDKENREIQEQQKLPKQHFPFFTNGKDSPQRSEPSETDFSLVSTMVERISI